MFIPLHSVHLFRNQLKCGRLPSGITGRNAPESVVDLLRNDWSAWAGIRTYDRMFRIPDIAKPSVRRGQKGAGLIITLKIAGMPKETTQSKLALLFLEGK